MGQAYESGALLLGLAHAELELDIWGNVMIPLALKYLWLMIPLDVIPLAYDTFG